MINRKNRLKIYGYVFCLVLFLITFFEMTYFYIESRNKTFTIESQAEIILDYYQKLEECD